MKYTCTKDREDTQVTVTMNSELTIINKKQSDVWQSSVYVEI